jgi:hypothetical protein
MTDGWKHSITNRESFDRYGRSYFITYIIESAKWPVSSMYDTRDRKCKFQQWWSSIHFTQRLHDRVVNGGSNFQVPP